MYRRLIYLTVLCIVSVVSAVSVPRGERAIESEGSAIGAVQASTAALEVRNIHRVRKVAFYAILSGFTAASTAGFAHGVSPTGALVRILAAVTLGGVAGLLHPDDTSPLSMADAQPVVQFAQDFSPDWLEEKGLQALDALLDPENEPARWLDEVVVAIQEYSNDHPDQINAGIHSGLSEKLPANVRGWIQARTGGAWLAA